jgi:cytochrome P460
VCYTNARNAGPRAGDGRVVSAGETNQRIVRRTAAAIAAAMALAFAVFAATGGGVPAPGSDLRGLSRADTRSIQGYERWTRLLGRPRPELAGLGSAHPGTKRIWVNRSARRLAPAGRQRFPYPVGTTIVKTARRGDAITLVAIMRKVARAGAGGGGWDFVEYQRSSGSAAFQRVGGGEGVCTGCHRLAQQRQRSDWVFSRLR